MNPDVVEQLRSYLGTIEIAAPPITLDELEHVLVQRESVEQPTRSMDDPMVGPEWELNEDTASADQKRWVGVVMAVAAMILVFVGVAVVSDQDRTNVVTDPASPPVSTDPVVSSSAVEPVASLAAVDSLGFSWSRVPHDDDVLGDRVPFTRGMSDVTFGGPGLVAVGEGDEGSAVWTSVDAITWTRVPHDEAVLGGANRMQSVTAGGPGLVAVGGPSDFDEDGGDAAVWTSVDGLTWSRVPHDETVFGGEGEQGMQSVTSGGPGLVAVGWDGSIDASDAAVWTSVDGLTWSRLPHDGAVFGGEGEQGMQSVTSGGPGLVAVGSVGFDDGIDRGELGNWNRDFLGSAVVWTSVDGITWSRIPHDEAVFGGEGNQWMDAVTTTGSGLVAVGGDWMTEGIGAAAVWTSVDGTAWTRVPHDEAVFGGASPQEMNSITSARSGLVAVGRAWASSGDDSAASVWTSVDGITWSWMGYDEAVFGSKDNTGYILSEGPVFTEYRQFMSSINSNGSSVVAVGADWSGPAHGSAVWIGVMEE